MPLRLSPLRSLRNLFSARDLPARARPVAPARRALLCEQLEDRTVLSNVSALASAASFATPLDASGTTDLVTIAVKDAAGKPISGLHNGDFALSLTAPPLPPGTVEIALFRQPSTGTFGPVTEIGTSGTYSTLFAGLLAGTPRNLTVSIDGTTLSSHPSVQVTPGAVSAANSTVAFNTDSTFTISVVDAAGNAITGLPGSAFQLDLSGVPTAGTFGALTETFPGAYTIPFTETRLVPDKGIQNTLTVTVDGVQLSNQSTITVSKAGGTNVDPTLPGLPGSLIGGGDTGTTVAQLAPQLSVASLTVASGATDLVTIVVKRTDGSVVSGLTDRDFTLRLSGGTSTGAFGSVSETATPGSYTTQFTGRTAGTTLTLTVTVDGVPATNQRTIRVTPGAVSAPDSTVDVVPSASGAGVVAISLKDAAGNAVTGRPAAAFQIAVSDGTSAATFGAVTEMGTSGAYTATFSGNVVNTPSALTVVVDGVQISGPPPVTKPPVTKPVDPRPPVAAAPTPVFSGVFMFGSMMVLEGSGFPGGFAVIPLPPGSFALFADANGDGHGDVVLLVPHLIVVLDGLTGAALAVPF